MDKAGVEPPGHWPGAPRRLAPARRFGDAGEGAGLVVAGDDAAAARRPLQFQRFEVGDGLPGQRQLLRLRRGLLHNEHLLERPGTILPAGGIVAWDGSPWLVREDIVAQGLHFPATGFVFPSSP